MKVLITGVAGTGKSAIVKALNERGIFSIDLHDVPDLCFWQDKKTKEKVEYAPVHSREWFDTVDRLCDLDQLKGILGQHDNIIVAGTASGNQTEYFPLFDKVILLQCDPKTLIYRLQTRTNKSGFGKTKAEQDDNTEWQKEFDPLVLSHGAIPVKTEGDLNKTVDKILKVIGDRDGSV
ncbi:MAG: AAA family ATPase [Candidatus Brennerbacteria bacterium]